MAVGLDRAIAPYVRLKRNTLSTRILLRRMLSWSVVGCLAGYFAAATPAGAFQLITTEEAALPAGTVPALELRGSPTRRPNVTVVSPPPGAGLVHSPLDLKLQFRAFGGAEIDPNSVVVTYLKDPAIDVTQRLTPFISAAGIDVSQTDVPP